MNFLRVKDLRIQLERLPDDTIVVVADNERGVHYAAQQVKMIDGRVIVSEYDEFDNLGPRVEIDERAEVATNA